MNRDLMYALADTLGCELEVGVTGIVLGGVNRGMSFPGTVHQHRVVVLSSHVAPEFIAVGVRVLGDLGFVVVAENFANIPVTVYVIDRSKVELVSLFANGANGSMSEIKAFMKKHARARFERDSIPVVSTKNRPWVKTG